MIIDFKKTWNDLLEKNPFQVVDIGARDGCKTVFKPIESRLHLLAFEPDDAEFERLSAKASSKTHFIRSAVYRSKSTLNLHVTKSPYFSSVFAPNKEFLSRFDRANTQGYEIQKTIAVQSDALDNLIPQEMRGRVDWIKIDAEGCAYEILDGARKTLEENLILGLYIEAEFNAKYQGQRLYSDVDALLRNYHYELIDFKDCRWKRAAGLKTSGTEGQPVHGCFLYMLEGSEFFKRLQTLSVEEQKAKIVKAVIFCSLYGIYDAALDLIHESKRRSILNQHSASLLKSAFKPTTSFFSRIPKLKNRSPLARMFYHAFMLMGGVWLDRSGKWRPEVRL